MHALRRALPWLLFAVFALLAIRSTRMVWIDAGARPARQASDALPLYLAGAAVHEGFDPTTQEGLEAAFAARKVVARAATFSNLYPASAGVLVGPITRGSWDEFVRAWRALLLAGGLLAGIAGGLAGARGRYAPAAAAVGAWLAVGAFPVTAECIGLGQANLLVGGLMGLCMLGLSRGWFGLAGLAALAGAGLKLVPGVGILPLLLGRKWRGLLWTTLAGLLLFAVTAMAVPPERMITALRATLQFQGNISPDWLNRIDTPDWLVFLGDWRHRGTGLLTLLYVGFLLLGLGPPLPGPIGRLLGATGPFDEARFRAGAAGAIALCAAWLGADAAAFHVLYAPLYIPAFAWLLTWPLDREAPRAAWLVLPLAALPAWLTLHPLGPLEDTARLVVAGLVIWGVALIRLALLSPPLPRLAWALLGVAAGFGAAWGDVRNERPLGPAPGSVETIEAWGLPEGVGHGGPRPGTGVLDPEQAAAIAMERPRPAQDALSSILLERVLTPRAAQRLTSHLNQAPLRWEGVAGAEELVSEMPPPPAAQLTYGEIATWLARERASCAELPGTEIPADELARTLRVLASEPQR